MQNMRLKQQRNSLRAPNTTTVSKYYKYFLHLTSLCFFQTLFNLFLCCVLYTIQEFNSTMKWKNIINKTGNKPTAGMTYHLSSEVFLL